MYKIKNILALVITLALSLSFVSAFAATGDTSEPIPGGSNFAMKEVSVVDAKTLKISFTNDLLEDVSTFEFLLTPKSDDTKEIALTGITLSSPNELTVNTSEDLKSGEEYNLVVIFVSDKEGKIIENGVDGMVTFIVPATTTPNTPMDTNPTDVTPMNNIPTDNNTPTDNNIPMDAAPLEGTPVNNGVTTDSTGVTTENAAASTNPTEVKTGPEEIMVGILAMILGLGLMYTRRRKA